MVLTPISNVYLVTTFGVDELESDHIEIDNVGCKAFGLCTLPIEWRPNFFVISSDLFTSENIQNREQFILFIADALLKSNLKETKQVLIRSSGINETLAIRGQLDSKLSRCIASEILDSAISLDNSLKLNADNPSTIHYVVQDYIDEVSKGHLSNERRCSREARDFLLEVEPISGRSGYIESVAIRKWRTGSFTKASLLACNSIAAIGISLKPVASWATQFNSRLHFEWVLGRNAIWIVQVDVEYNTQGVDPHTLLPENVPYFESDNLRTFRIASESDFFTYRKLKNARSYVEIGYSMPNFYILDQSIVQTLLNDEEIDDALKFDLEVLTSRPLILRCDGLELPSDKREMLPRSDELRSVEAAIDWLLNDFSLKIKKANIQDSKLCIIAHHFIPSVSSAWARAEPGNRIVRIESLWGIPEGLYWFSHDTFEVDTGNVDISTVEIDNYLGYKLRHRYRYKGRFIAPDENGAWIPQSTDPAHDWSRSIKNQKWIYEIARSTRLISEKSSEPTSVMWFIDTHESATSHKVLPWFHSKSTSIDGIKAAPRRKISSNADFVIKDKIDWENLQEKFLGGSSLVERVVISPEDTDLIRNNTFTNELAQLAKRFNFTIELSGGILSHAYYLLSSKGCKVEVVDLFGADEETVEFNKLVRDKIPEVITNRGERVESAKLSGDALVLALRKKLVEESFEALDAKSGDELLSELADVQEVLYSLCNELNISKDHLEEERQKKFEKRGGFNSGFMLLRTSSPQSISGMTADGGMENSELFSEDNELIKIEAISDPNNLPVAAPFKRPDKRTIDGRVEKVFSFKTDVNDLSDFNEALSFEMPIEEAGNNQFSMRIKLERDKSKLRGDIKLQVGAAQLEFVFK